MNVSKRKHASGEVRLYVDPNDVTLDPANANGHPTDNLVGIAASLKAYGQQTPVVLTGAGVVQKGNGTVMAAREIGLASVWFTTTDLEGVRLAAYGIADNQTGKSSVWVDERLTEHLRRFREEAEPVVTGFTLAQEDALLAKCRDEVEPGDEAEFGQGEQSAKPQDFLSWGKVKIPLTAEERERLDALHAAYLSDNGTPYGFAGRLMRV